MYSPPRSHTVPTSSALVRPASASRAAVIVAKGSARVPGLSSSPSGATKTTGPVLVVASATGFMTVVAEASDVARAGASTAAHVRRRDLIVEFSPMSGGDVATA